MILGFVHLWFNSLASRVALCLLGFAHPVSTALDAVKTTTSPSCEMWQCHLSLLSWYVGQMPGQTHFLDLCVFQLLDLETLRLIVLQKSRGHHYKIEKNPKK